LIAIEKLAAFFKTSLTAAAIRYATLTDAAAAILISTGSSVDYCFASSALRQIRGYKHPSKGSILPRDSLTRNFNQIENNIRDANREDDSADLISWFQAESEVDASEEVVGLGEYGKTLTVIVAELPEEDSA
jgi:choline dehydrogenase-like flavoprotein